MSFTKAQRFFGRLRFRRRRQKFLPAVSAAKIERLSIVLSAESGGFVHGHAADGIVGVSRSGFGHLLLLAWLQIQADVATKRFAFDACC